MKRNGDQTCFRKDIRAFMFSRGDVFGEVTAYRQDVPPLISPGIQAGLGLGPDLLRGSGQEGSD